MRDKNTSSPAFDVSRRRFALQSVALGGSMLIAKTALSADAPAPNQATGPVQQDGLSPRLTMHGLDTWHGTPAFGYARRAVCDRRRAFEVPSDDHAGCKRTQRASS